MGQITSDKEGSPSQRVPLIGVPGGCQCQCQTDPKLSCFKFNSKYKWNIVVYIAKIGLLILINKVRIARKQTRISWTDFLVFDVSLFPGERKLYYCNSIDLFYISLFLQVIVDQLWKQFSYSKVSFFAFSCWIKSHVLLYFSVLVWAGSVHLRGVGVQRGSKMAKSFHFVWFVDTCWNWTLNNPPTSSTLRKVSVETRERNFYVLWIY